jgi:hypothetical protein
MGIVIDEFTLTYPGVKNVEHEYFYAVHGCGRPDETRLLGQGVCAGSRVLNAAIS